MRQKYFCPNCGTRLVCGERFCIGCGINFTWVIEPIQPQSTPAGYGNQYPGQQSYQEWPMYDQQSGSGPQSGLNYNSLSQGKNSSGGNAVAPISAEISKLLANFEKHIKYKGVS
jgi:hypothetical protein